MDIAMSRITAMVDEIKLYDTGYAFLCDSKGDMVYHNRYPNGMTLEEIKKNSLFTFIDDNYSSECSWLIKKHNKTGQGQSAPPLFRARQIIG